MPERTAQYKAEDKSRLLDYIAMGEIALERDTLTVHRAMKKNFFYVFLFASLASFHIVSLLANPYVTT